jgi:hypothetical protein
MFVQIGGSRSQTSWAGWLRHTIVRKRKVFGLEWRVRLEADHIAAVAQVNERAAPCADWTTLQAVLIEIDRAEVFAVAAILPLQIDRCDSLTLEVELAEKVTAILTLDGALSRSEKSSFVLGTEYSHFRSSL